MVICSSLLLTDYALVLEDMKVPDRADSSKHSDQDPIYQQMSAHTICMHIPVSFQS